MKTRRNIKKGKMTRKMRAGGLFDFFSKATSAATSAAKRVVGYKKFTGCEEFRRSFIRDFIPKRKIIMKKKYNHLINEIQKKLNEKIREFGKQKDRFVLTQKKESRGREYFIIQEYDLEKFIGSLEGFKEDLDDDLSDKIKILDDYLIEQILLSIDFSNLKDDTLCSKIAEYFETIAKLNDINYYVQTNKTGEVTRLDKYAPKIKTKAKGRFFKYYGGNSVFDTTIKNFIELIKDIDYKKIEKIRKILKEDGKKKSFEEFIQYGIEPEPIKVESTIFSQPKPTYAPPNPVIQSSFIPTAKPQQLEQTTIIPKNDEVKSSKDMAKFIISNSSECPEGQTYNKIVGSCVPKLTFTSALTTNEPKLKSISTTPSIPLAPAPAPAPGPAPKLDFLSQIKQGKELKKSGPVPEKKSETTGFSGSTTFELAMKQRRGAVQGNDKEEEEEEEDDEWEGGGKKRRRHSKKHPKKSHKKSHKK